MVNITRDFVTLMKCRYARNFSNRQQVKRVHLEKAAASASISEAAQEVYLLLLLYVEAVVVSSNRPTVVVAVNNEVESKSQRFCERCSRPTVRIFFLQALAGHLLALVYCTWQQDCLHHGGALVANFTQQSLLLLCRQRSALYFTGTYRFFAKFCKQYYSCLGSFLFFLF